MDILGIPLSIVYEFSGSRPGSGTETMGRQGERSGVMITPSLG